MYRTIFYKFNLSKYLIIDNMLSIIINNIKLNYKNYQVQVIVYRLGLLRKGISQLLSIILI